MNNKIIFPVIIFITFISLFLFLGALTSFGITGKTGFSQGKTEEKIVTKIIDGDTIIVEGGERVRLLSIDCDERGGECYKEAKEFLEKLIFNKKVILEFGVEDKDQYDRSLRYVFVNGVNVNLKLVEDGFCIARFERDEKYKSEIQQAEKNAIENKVGCRWGGL